ARPANAGREVPCTLYSLLPFAKLTGGSVNMYKNEEKEVFIRFDHSVYCIKGDCERLTSWGHAMYWDGGREIMLLPLCWEHGFALRDFVPTGEQQIVQYIKEQNASVERFVVEYHGGKGTARVIASCDPQDVPRFTL